MQVGLTSEPSMAPVVVLSDGDVTGKDMTGVQWMCGVGLVVALLDQLKKAYWSWDWPLVRNIRHCYRVPMSQL